MNEKAPGLQPANKKSGKRENRKANHGGTALVLSFAAMFVLLGLLAFWPVTKQFIPGLADPPLVQELGAIERVSFVGGLGVRTQVDVGGRVLLLRGAVEIQKNQQVQRRTTALDDQLCVVGSDRCYEILSR